VVMVLEDQCEDRKLNLYNSNHFIPWFFIGDVVDISSVHTNFMYTSSHTVKYHKKRHFTIVTNFNTFAILSRIKKAELKKM